MRQIADDKGLTRFQARPEGAEIPREVYAAAVEQIASAFVERGWSFAKSGPHLTRKHGPVNAKIGFNSSTQNVAEELVSLSVWITVGDRSHRAWRAEAGHPSRLDDIVSTRHLGRLLDPPRWLEWNLADRSVRAETIADVKLTLKTAVETHVDPLIERLAAAGSPGDLVRLVDDASLVEYYIRHGLAESTGPVIGALLARYGDRGRDNFLSARAVFEADGLPELAPKGAPQELAALVVHYRLPVDG